MQRLLKLGALLGAYGADPKQLRLRGWGSSVSSIAQWPVGPASRRCDIFFSFDEKTGLAAAAVEVEADDLCLNDHPDAARVVCARMREGGGSADAAGASTDSDTGGGSFKKPYKVLPVDKQFFDAIAQELMGNEKLVTLAQPARPAAVRTVADCQQLRRGDAAALRGGRRLRGRRPEHGLVDDDRGDGHAGAKCQSATT